MNQVTGTGEGLAVVFSVNGKNDREALNAGSWPPMMSRSYPITKYQRQRLRLRSDRFFALGGWHNRTADCRNADDAPKTKISIQGW